MIKTFINTDVVQLDKAVNDFMTTQGRDGPVRTESYVVSGKETVNIYHKATVFFNAISQAPTQSYAGVKIENSVPATNGKKEKIGALWIQKDQSISGTLNEGRVVIPDEVKGVIAFMQTPDVEMTINGIAVKVMRNKYKTTSKHPDFVIYPK